MKIEYKNILISSENLEFYKSSGLHKGQRVVKWNLLENRKTEEGKILLYTYTIDSRLNLPRRSPIRKIVKDINSSHKQTLFHELHHVYNEDYGLKIYLANAICFLYLILFCLDEISAITAEELCDTPGALSKIIKTKVKGIFGQKAEDRAIINAIKTFKPVFNYYCDKWVESYKKEIMILNKNDVDITSILKKQNKIYEHNLNEFKDILYSKELYQIVENYFTFNGECIKTKLSKSSIEKIKKEWEQFEIQIFKYARNCIKELQK